MKRKASNIRKATEVSFTNVGNLCAIGVKIASRKVAIWEDGQDTAETIGHPELYFGQHVEKRRSWVVRIKVSCVFWEISVCNFFSYSCDYGFVEGLCWILLLLNE